MLAIRTVTNYSIPAQRCVARIQNLDDDIHEWVIGVGELTTALLRHEKRELGFGCRCWRCWRSGRWRWCRCESRCRRRWREGYRRRHRCKGLRRHWRWCVGRNRRVGWRGRDGWGGRPVWRCRKRGARCLGWSRCVCWLNGKPLRQSLRERTRTCQPSDKQNCTRQEDHSGSFGHNFRIILPSQVVRRRLLYHEGGGLTKTSFDT